MCLAGCKQVFGLDDLPPDGGAPPPTDTPADTPPDIPDAGPCQALGPTCVGDVLRTCVTIGESPTDETCSFGCSDDGGSHCRLIVPSGGAVLSTDLVPTPGITGTVTITTAVIDTATGSIAGIRNPGAGIVDGIRFEVRNNVGIFTFEKLVITGNVTFQGNNAVAFVSLTDISSSGNLDALGGNRCMAGVVPPGGNAGVLNQDGGGPGGGVRGTGGEDDCSGGGGGGHGAAGGRGGNSAGETGGTGGIETGDDIISVLTGGSAGGSGAALGAGPGGHGGGAIQLVANEAITISAGIINVGGCGGLRGGDDASGGGGGAGGTLLFEAGLLTISGGNIAANGGGGGGGNNGATGEAGKPIGVAQGGTSSDGVGGDGAADNTMTGANGGNDSSEAGGAGGGIGRIRLNSLAGAATITGGTISPSPAASGTRTTQGTITLQ